MIHLQMQQEIKSSISQDIDDLKSHFMKLISQKSSHSDIDSLNQMIQAILLELRHKATKEDLIPYLWKMELIAKEKELLPP